MTYKEKIIKIVNDWGPILTPDLLSKIGQCNKKYLFSKRNKNNKMIKHKKCPVCESTNFTSERKMKRTVTPKSVREKNPNKMISGFIMNIFVSVVINGKRNHIYDMTK